MNRQRDLDVIAPDDPIIEPVVKVEPIIQSENIVKVNSHVVKKQKKVVEENISTNKACYRQNQRIDEIMNRARGQFSTFIPKPKDFSFEERDECEEIIIVLRPHWFTNIKWILICTLFLLLPTLIEFVNQMFFNNSLFFGLVGKGSIFPETYSSIAMFFWYLFIFIFGFESFLSWYFDIYIITDKRVVDIHFNNLLDKKFSEANIESIQDVTSRISGLSQTIFNYGDILIQTAGALSEINFMKIPHPNVVTEIIQELRQDIKDKNKKENINE